MLFKITEAFKTVHGISLEILNKYKVRGLLLDLDNTLTTHDNPKPADGVLDWLANMQKNGIKLIIVSNNSHERVKPFAQMLGLEFVSKGKKPLSKGFKEASERMKLPLNELAVVGDQIFTDVLGANLIRTKCFYVFPIEHEKTAFFKLKRKLEIPWLPKLK